MTNNFTPADWSHSTNIYEVNLRQYSSEGTINAFLKHLPRLKEMGVETLWFMPLTPIAQKNKKGSLGSYYACADYTAVSPEFGTIEDFKTLVKEAHALGFKVIIDWVANHTGWDHKWTKEHPEWYQKDTATGDFKMASGMEDIIELDFKNPELRKAMIEAMKFWVTTCDIDGFRSDLAFWVELDFWKEARTELEKTKKLFWLGELDPLDHPEYMGVYDAAYTWTWMHKAKEFYHSGLPISELDSVLEKYKIPGNTSMRAWFTSNHDENSWNGTEFEKYGEMAKALAVFSCTWNGIPLLYSGQELPNKKRLKFFEKDPIEWTGKNELHDFYKTLLSLHSQHPALRAGDENVKTVRLKTTADDKIFAFLKKNRNREVLVILNFSKKSNLSFEISDERVYGEFQNVFTGKTMNFTNKKRTVINAWDWLLFQK
ncbi:MAG TPA: alpha-amylase family glycosyl hydrolase [Chitinophagaceae bacterium]|nr:alpha-amylase family glycosyl hydrolase [Chitinophagaceae bacterium]